jgi:hypothetical protein
MMAYDDYVDSRGVTEFSGGASASSYKNSEVEDMLKKEADSIIYMGSKGKSNLHSHKPISRLPEPKQCQCQGKIRGEPCICKGKFTSKNKEGSIKKHRKMDKNAASHVIREGEKKNKIFSDRMRESYKKVNVEEFSNKSNNISRFSDCGHTKEGEFDHGNTCGSLKGGNNFEDDDDSSISPKKMSKSEIERDIADFKSRLKDLEFHASQLPHINRKNYGHGRDGKWAYDRALQKAKIAKDNLDYSKDLIEELENELRTRGSEKSSKSLKEFSNEDKNKLKNSIIDYFNRNDGYLGHGYLASMRKSLGYADFDPKNPLENPVHSMLKELINENKIEEIKSSFGGPSFAIKRTN